MDTCVSVNMDALSPTTSTVSCTEATLMVAGTSAVLPSATLTLRSTPPKLASVNVTL